MTFNGYLMSTFEQTGSTSKCPACGWRLDADAYQCPKCLVYFCHKCRKRVQKGDAQFQCVNQTCDCHGKLVCSACTAMVSEYEDVQEKVLTKAGVHYPATDGINWTTLCFAAVIGCVGCFGSFISGICAFVVTMFACEALFKKPAQDIPPEYTTKTTNRLVRSHRSCIKCRQPVENLQQ